MNPRPQRQMSPCSLRIEIAVPEPELTPVIAVALLRILQHHHKNAGALRETKLSVDDHADWQQKEHAGART